MAETTAAPAEPAPLHDHTDLIAGLRDFAAWVEAHPELPPLNVFARSFYFGGGDEVEKLRIVAQALPDFTIAIDAKSVVPSVAIRHDFGPVDFEADCRSKKLGETKSVTREVVEHVLPDWLTPTVKAQS